MADTPEADVCLILEGTYPFVTGGVSTWVHDLILGMPERTFSVVHISASRQEEMKVRYELPPNVVSFVECFVHDAVIHTDRCRGWSPWSARRLWRAFKAFHGSPMDLKREPFERMMRACSVPGERVLNTRDLVLSGKSWRYLLGRYWERRTRGSFIDYFWTWRAIHMPIFQILNAEIPPAKLYHLVSTGYAGLAGVVAKLRTGRPLVLSEHGIYVKERKIEINRADWIYTEPEKIVKVKTRPGILKELWINNFLILGKLCYEHCDQIITLFAGNQEIQKEFGAPLDRLEIIPNGVQTEVFGPLRDVDGPDDGVRRVGFIGRVVPIKDVKCFIKACKLCADQVDDVEFLILGPTDEDPQYFAECETLVEMLGMGDRITFYGPVDVKEYYPKLDVSVLTSISEGQPLIILEASCAGVPTVATGVGSCAELLLGRTEEDRALGPSGMITNIGRPDETGQALVKLLTDEPLRQDLIQAGFERIERYYRQDKVIADYEAIYEHYTEAS